MPVLPNPRHEQFATLVAGGMIATEAYSIAGFAGKGAAPSASRLAKNPGVACRIAELRNSVSTRSINRAIVDREYVLARLKQNVERAMQVEPVLDSRGKKAGFYRYDGNVANRALELLGRELGMFRDRGDDELPWNGDLKTLTDSQLAKLTEYSKQVMTESGFPPELTDSQLDKIIKYAEQVAADGRLPDAEATTPAPGQTH